MISTDQRQRLREAVRFFYDLQKLRIQQGNRAGSDTIMLDEKDREFHETRSGTLNQLERSELKNIERLCKQSGPEIYKWLRAQKGIGPTMCGVIMSEVNIEKAETVSSLWRFTGLDVMGTKVWVDVEAPRFSAQELRKMPTIQMRDSTPITEQDEDDTFELKFSDGVERYWLSADGEEMRIQKYVNRQAPRPIKGQKLTYNAWFRTKIVGVAADCMIKAGSPWRQYYDNYKLRKQSERLDKCMGCDGTGKAKKGENKGKTCKNCKGKGTDAPWGESDGHRHRASIRYMMKQFLAALYREWRSIEGLVVHPPYAEAVLGRVHGDHQGMGISMTSSEIHSPR